MTKTPSVIALEMVEERLESLFTALENPGMKSDFLFGAIMGLRTAYSLVIQQINDELGQEIKKEVTTPEMIADAE